MSRRNSRSRKRGGRDRGGGRGNQRRSLSPSCVHIRNPVTQGDGELSSRQNDTLEAGGSTKSQCADPGKGQAASKSQRPPLLQAPQNRRSDSRGKQQENHQLCSVPPDRNRQPQVQPSNPTHLRPKQQHPQKIQDDAGTNQWNHQRPPNPWQRHPSPHQSNQSSQAHQTAEQEIKKSEKEHKNQQSFDSKTKLQDLPTIVVSGVTDSAWEEEGSTKQMNDSAPLTEEVKRKLQDQLEVAQRNVQEQQRLITQQSRQRGRGENRRRGSLGNLGDVLPKLLDPGTSYHRSLTPPEARSASPTWRQIRGRGPGGQFPNPTQSSGPYNRTFQPGMLRPRGYSHPLNGPGGNFYNSAPDVRTAFSNESLNTFDGGFNFGTFPGKTFGHENQGRKFLSSEEVDKNCSVDYLSTGRFLLGGGSRPSSSNDLSSEGTGFDEDIHGEKSWEFTHSSHGDLEEIQEKRSEENLFGAVGDAPKYQDPRYHSSARSGLYTGNHSHNRIPSRLLRKPNGVGQSSRVMPRSSSQYDLDLLSPYEHFGNSNPVSESGSMWQHESCNLRPNTHSWPKDLSRYNWNAFKAAYSNENLDQISENVVDWTARESDVCEEVLKDQTQRERHDTETDVEEMVAKTTSSPSAQKESIANIMKCINAIKSFESRLIGNTNWESDSLSHSLEGIDFGGKEESSNLQRNLALLCEDLNVPEPSEFTPANEALDEFKNEMESWKSIFDPRENVQEAPCGTLCEKMENFLTVSKNLQSIRDLTDNIMNEAQNTQVKLMNCISSLDLFHGTTDQTDVHIHQMIVEFVDGKVREGNTNSLPSDWIELYKNKMEQCEEKKWIGSFPFAGVGSGDCRGDDIRRENNTDLKNLEAFSEYKENDSLANENPHCSQTELRLKNDAHFPLLTPGSTCFSSNESYVSDKALHRVSSCPEVDLQYSSKPQSGLVPSIDNVRVNSCSTNPRKKIESVEQDEFSMKKNTLCPQCKQTYRWPHALDCLHVFCFPCASKLVKKGKKREDKYRVKCTMCGTFTKMNKQDPNLLLIDLPKCLSMCKSKISPFNCTLCTNYHEAKAYCNTCSNYLCSACRTSHNNDKAFLAHSVTESLKVMSKFGELFTVCPKHQGQLLRQFCQTCNTPLCPTCSEAGHTGHRIYKDTNCMDFMNQTRGRINAQNRILSAGAQNLRGQLQNAKIVKQNIETAHRLILRKIDDFCNTVDEMVQEANHYMNRVLDDIQDFAHKLVSDLEEELTAKEEALLGVLDFYKRVLKSGCISYVMVSASHLTKAYKNLAELYEEIQEFQGIILDIHFVPSFPEVNEFFHDIFHDIVVKSSIHVDFNDNINLSERLEDNPVDFCPYGVSVQASVDGKTRGQEGNSGDSGVSSASDSLFMSSSMEYDYSRMTFSFKNIFGKYGRGLYEFAEPSGVEYLSDGSLAVCDTKNHRIMIYDENYEFVRCIGQPPNLPPLDEPSETTDKSNDANFGRSHGKLYFPYRLAQCPLTKNIVVVERQPSLYIQIFSVLGDFITCFGNDVLRSPRGITVDENGVIIVVEGRSMKVARFSQQGKKLFAVHVALHLEFPNDIAARYGRIYISDNRAHCVHVFDYTMERLFVIGNTSVTYYPIGVTLNNQGQVIVTDNHNTFNVSIFEPDGTYVRGFKSRAKYANCFNVSVSKIHFDLAVTTRDSQVLVFNYEGRNEQQQQQQQQQQHPCPEEVDLGQ